ncbi:ATP-dependent RNA helicase DbpA [Salinisphaera sp. T31B1]|uniref:ATP-dependent RNA helicase DbpA n=1 Tax=Salinisphaera sp. T31B1 TaxID=727963 RepID=UPI003340C9F9
MNAFSSFALSAPLLDALAARGYQTPTPIQAAALPCVLARRDVIAQAATGSGKTVVFGLGVLQSLAPERTGLQALIVCPTRELADQVAGAVRQLAMHLSNVKVLTLCGGTPIRHQRSSLEHPPHIVVATPGRLLAHLRNGHLAVDTLRTLVLDEADRMLEMGFDKDIDAIVAYLPTQRQTLMFSATWPEPIRRASARLQHDPVDAIADAPTDRPDIREQRCDVGAHDKLTALVGLLGAARDDGRALVFCNTRAATDRVTADLSRRGFSALALHGDRDQRERDEVLIRFGHGSCRVLVATDVAARGLDITDLPLVISFDVARDAETHTHRIGRTGRAGSSGRAIILCGTDERERADRIAQSLNRQPERIGVERMPSTRPAPAPWVTLRIEGGRRDKLRPGDLLGALTGDAGLPGSAVGRIDIQANRSYVAIDQEHARTALARLHKHGIKRRRLRISIVGER